MRLSIVLAICFLGVASASTLVKRDQVDDLKNKGQDALKNLNNFGQEFSQKLQDAFKNLFGKHDSTVKPVEKRATNPFELINAIGDPAKFMQTLFKMLAEMAQQGGLNQNMTAEAMKLVADMNDPIKLAQHAFKLFNQMSNQQKGGAKKPATEAVVAKRAVNPLELLNNLNDPAKFMQTLFKILADMAQQGGLNQNVASDALKLVAEMNDPMKLAQNMFKLFTQLSNQPSKPKRDVSNASVDDTHEENRSAWQKIKDTFAGMFGSKKPADKVVKAEDSTQVSVQKRSADEDSKAQNQASAAAAASAAAEASFVSVFIPVTFIDLM